MALVRWEPVRELSSLQTDVNRLFNAFFDTTTTGANGDGAPRRWVPAMDLVETEDQFVLKADLPGLAEDDVHIDVEDDVLTVSGERKAEHEDKREGYVRVERSYGAFRRSLTLPEGVEPEAVSASFERGVLEIRIPKPEERKPRRVAIQVGSRPAAIEGDEAT
jgi:HSP20 family protein